MDAFSFDAKSFLIAFLINFSYSQHMKSEIWLQLLRADTLQLLQYRDRTLSVFE